MLLWFAGFKPDSMTAEVPLIACRKRKIKFKLNSEIKPEVWQKPSTGWMD